MSYPDEHTPCDPGLVVFDAPAVLRVTSSRMIRIPVTVAKSVAIADTYLLKNMLNDCKNADMYFNTVNIVKSVNGMAKTNRLGDYLSHIKSFGRMLLNN